MIGNNLKVRECSLQKSGQRTEGRYSQPARSGVFIVLEALERNPSADLMNALGDVHVIAVGEQISAAPKTALSFEPADVIAADPLVVAPPPTTMPPGPAPVTNDRLAGNDANGGEPKSNAPREKPARKTFRMFGYTTCVSSTLATCERS